MIVIGVLIALGLEQGIEAIHNRHLAAEAEEAITGEIKDNIGRIVYGLEWQHCTDKKLDEIRDLLAPA